MRQAVLARKSRAAATSGTKASRAGSCGLRIGPPDDVLEQEADRVANEVVAGRQAGPHWSLSNISPDTNLHRKRTCGGSADAGGKCEESRRWRVGATSVGAQALQHGAPNQAAPATVPPIVYEVLRSPGQPLEVEARSFMESRFGHDFSKVKVHTDARAAESARAVSARAYTVGNDIVLGRGHSIYGDHGNRLLAHELTHVAQQRRAPTPVLQRDAEEGKQEADPGGQDELNAALYRTLYSSVEQDSPQILIAYANSLAPHYDEAATNPHLVQSRMALGSILTRIHETLEADAQTAKRGAEGALLERGFGDYAPWTPARPESVSDIPVFTSERIVAWQGDAGLYQREFAKPKPKTVGKKEARTAPPGFRELVPDTGVAPPSAATPAPAGQKPAFAPQGGKALNPDVQVQPRSPEEKAAQQTGGGAEVLHGLSVLASHRLSSVTGARQSGAGKSPAGQAGADQSSQNDPNLLDASAELWFISNRLYQLDRNGNLESTESWTDVSGLEGFKAGGVYFVRPVTGQGRIRFVAEPLEGPSLAGEGSILFPRVLTALIPMLERTEELAKEHAGVGLIVARTFGDKNATPTSPSLDRLGDAGGRAVDKLPAAVEREVERQLENPVAAVANLALGMGIEYLSKAVPIVGQAVMLYQLIELGVWLGEVANIAMFAPGSDEIDFAAQAIARKIAEFVVQEAMMRLARRGIHVATGPRAAEGALRSETAPPPGEKGPTFSAGEKGMESPGQPGGEPMAKEQAPPARPKAAARETPAEPKPAMAPPAAQPAASPAGEKALAGETPTGEKPVTPQGAQPAAPTGEPKARAGETPTEEKPRSLPAEAKTPAAAPPAEAASAAKGAETTGEKTAAATPAPAATPATTEGVHAIDDALSADRTSLGAKDPAVRARFKPEQLASLDRLQSAYESYKQKKSEDALSPEDWLRSQTSGQPRQDAEELFGEDYKRAGTVVAEGERPTVALKDISRPADLDDARLKTNLDVVKSNAAAWDRLDDLKAEGVKNGRISAGLLRILKGNIGEILARPILEARLKLVQEKISGARFEFNTRVAKIRPDGTYSAPVLFSDGLIVTETGGQLKLHDVFEVKSGKQGGAEAQSQFFEWREGELKDGDQLVLEDGRRFTYAPEGKGKGRVLGMQMATAQIVVPKGAEHLGTESGEQVGAKTTRTALGVSAAELEYIARRLLETLPQKTEPEPAASAAPQAAHKAAAHDLQF
jgi:hypothetical protein